MENNNMLLSEQTVSKEYQIPELVDLNRVNEAKGSYSCHNGSNPGVSQCGSGSHAST